MTQPNEPTPYVGGTDPDGDDCTPTDTQAADDDKDGEDGADQD